MIQFDSEDTELIMTLARDLTGTKVNSTHHGVIVQNVAQRIAEAGCATLEQYLEYVDRNDEEMSQLISAVTIHTTGWFREAGAFEKLESLLNDKYRELSQPVRFKVLSVACSTGEEVYSLAAVLEGFRRLHSKFDYEIEGWDIDPISLRTARQGSYPATGVTAISGRYKTYLAQIGNASGEMFNISEAAKDRCHFKTINILGQPESAGDYNFIMCRNVLIYFEVIDVATIVNQLSRKTAPDGHICVGVSETSAMSALDLQPVGHATFAKRPPAVDSLSARSKRAAGRITCVKNTATKIVLVEDEPTIRSLMLETLSTIGYDVVPAADAQEAVKPILAGDVGLVLSDYRMPGKNGLELCEEVRAKGYKGPFVIVSGGADRSMAEKGLSAGCNEVILKPLINQDLQRTVRAYVGDPGTSATKYHRPALILIGASTGGTEVLVRLLKDMPKKSPPVLVVQHITAGFAKDFGERLARVSGLTLASIKSGEILRNDHLYIALEDYHIGVKMLGGQLSLVVSNDPPISSHRPSVDYLFHSAAKCRQHAFAALLTGMGKDGASGLLQLKLQGADTFAQNEASCAVYGMPKEAVRLNAALFIMDPDEIRDKLELRLKTQVATGDTRKTG